LITKDDALGLLDPHCEKIWSFLSSLIGRAAACLKILFDTSGSGLERFALENIWQYLEIFLIITT
jgi:hypothetical protein